MRRRCAVLTSLVFSIVLVGCSVPPATGERLAELQASVSEIDESIDRLTSEIDAAIASGTATPDIVARLRNELVASKDVRQRLLDQITGARIVIDDGMVTPEEAGQVAGGIATAIGTPLAPWIGLGVTAIGWLIEAARRRQTLRAATEVVSSVDSAMSGLLASDVRASFENVLRDAQSPKAKRLVNVAKGRV